MLRHAHQQHYTLFRFDCLSGCRWDGMAGTTHMKYTSNAWMLFQSSWLSAYTACCTLADTWSLSHQTRPQTQLLVGSSQQARHLLASPCCLGARRTGLRSHQVAILLRFDELCSMHVAQGLCCKADVVGDTTFSSWVTDRVLLLPILNICCYWGGVLFCTWDPFFSLIDTCHHEAI